MKWTKIRNGFEEKGEDSNLGNGEFGVYMEHQGKHIY